MLTLLLYSLFCSAVYSAATGCTPTTVGTNGFVARFYSYPYKDTLGSNDNFFSSGYQTTLLKTVSGVTAANFQYIGVGSGVVTNTIYGYSTTISNFTVELSGFYLAPSTGIYIFTLTADEGASFQFGAGQGCCNDASGSVSGVFGINTLGVSVGAGLKVATYTLTKGVYYPIKVVLFNSQADVSFNLYATNPLGLSISDLGSSIYQASFSNGVCYTTVTSGWSNTYTSTTTQSGASTNTVVVGVPKQTAYVTSTWANTYATTTTASGSFTDTVVANFPTPVVTVTSLWTGSTVLVSTISGATQTVVVQVPISTVYVTSTWGNTYATTSTITGASTNTVVINLPTPTVTVTSAWTGTTTGYTTVTGLTNTVIVQVPKQTVRVTSTWGVSYATTTTGIGSLTDTVVINVPTPTVTVTSAWTGTTSGLTTIAGPTITVIVQVPKQTVFVTSTWAGSATLTTTNTGSLTDTVIINVPTPTVTLTSAWTGTTTGLITVIGATNTVIVQVPKQTIYVTSTWAGNSAGTTTNTGLLTDIVIVNVPTPTVTVTSAWTGSVNSLTTITGATNTVIVQVPKQTIYVTNTWISSFSATATITGILTDTVVVNVPTPTVTVTSAWASSTSGLTTITGLTNTVVIQVPKQTIVTTNTWTGQVSTTSTITGSFTDTVVVNVPTPTTIVTSPWTGTVVASTTIFGSTNTVVVQVPKQTSVSTNTWTGSFVTTSTISGLFSDTVVVFVPTPTVTVTSAWTGTSNAMTTVTGPTNTVIILVPKQTVYVTSTSSNSYAITSTITGAFTDTVVIMLPTPTVTVTSAWTGTTNAIITVTGLTNTVIVQVPKQTSTVTDTWTGSYTTSTTIVGILTDDVIINVPTPTVTVTSAWTGSVNLLTTVTGSTNTVIVQVPKRTVIVTNTWDSSFSTVVTISGSLTDTVVVDLPTPTVTVTSAWTGSVNAITTLKGPTNTVVIQVPRQIVYVTNTWADSVTSTVTLGGALTDTVVVNVPTPTVTVTSAWTGSTPGLITIIGATKTVIVQVPKQTVLVTNTWVGSIITTITNTGVLTDTVVVNVPTPTITVTSVWIGSAVFTSTITGATNTVLVQVPKQTVTVTNTWESSFPGVSVASGLFTDTVVVEVPSPTVTITSAWTDTYTISSTITGNSGQSNTKLVFIPKVFVTVTSTWGSSFVTTVTGSGTLTDIVTLIVPTPTTIVTSAWTGSVTALSTATGTSGESNTVVVLVPKFFETVTETWADSTGSITTIVGSLTDTVIVLVPTPTTTITSVWTGDQVSSIILIGSSGQSNTAVVVIPKNTVTMTDIWGGSYERSYTLGGVSTDTIVIEVPTPTQTVTSVWTGSYITSTTVTGGTGEKNTVVVQIPVEITPSSSDGQQRTSTMSVDGVDISSSSEGSTMPRESIFSQTLSDTTILAVSYGSMGKFESSIFALSNAPSSVAETSTFSGSSAIPDKTLSKSSEVSMVTSFSLALAFTIPWTGSFTVTTTLFGSDGVATLIVQTPESSASGASLSLSESTLSGVFDGSEFLVSSADIFSVSGTSQLEISKPSAESSSLVLEESSQFSYGSTEDLSQTSAISVSSPSSATLNLSSLDGLPSESEGESSGTLDFTSGSTSTSLLLTVSGPNLSSSIIGESVSMASSNLMPEIMSSTIPIILSLFSDLSFSNDEYISGLETQSLSKSDTGFKTEYVSNAESPAEPESSAHSTIMGDSVQGSSSFEIVTDNEPSTLSELMNQSQTSNSYIQSSAVLGESESGVSSTGSIHFASQIGSRSESASNSVSEPSLSFIFSETDSNLTSSSLSSSELSYLMSVSISESSQVYSSSFLYSVSETEAPTSDLTFTQFPSSLWTSVLSEFNSVGLSVSTLEVESFLTSSAIIPSEPVATLSSSNLSDYATVIDSESTIIPITTSVASPIISEFGSHVISKADFNLSSSLSLTVSDSDSERPSTSSLQSEIESSLITSFPDPVASPNTSEVAAITSLVSDLELSSFLPTESTFNSESSVFLMLNSESSLSLGYETITSASSPRSSETDNGEDSFSISELSAILSQTESSLFIPAVSDQQMSSILNGIGSYDSISLVLSTELSIISSKTDLGISSDSISTFVSSLSVIETSVVRNSLLSEPIPSIFSSKVDPGVGSATILNTQASLGSSDIGSRVSSVVFQDPESSGIPSESEMSVFSGSIFDSKSSMFPSGMGIASSVISNSNFEVTSSVGVRSERGSDNISASISDLGISSTSSEDAFETYTSSILRPDSSEFWNSSREVESGFTEFSSSYFPFLSTNNAVSTSSDTTFKGPGFSDADSGALDTLTSYSEDRESSVSSENDFFASSTTYSETKTTPISSESELDVSSVLFSNLDSFSDMGKHESSTVETGATDSKLLSSFSESIPRTFFTSNFELGASLSSSERDKVMSSDSISVSDSIAITSITEYAPSSSDPMATNLQSHLGSDLLSDLVSDPEPSGSLSESDLEIPGASVSDYYISSITSVSETDSTSISVVDSISEPYQFASSILSELSFSQMSPSLFGSSSFEFPITALKSDNSREFELSSTSSDSTTSLSISSFLSSNTIEDASHSSQTVQFTSRAIWSFSNEESSFGFEPSTTESQPSSSIGSSVEESSLESFFIVTPTGGFPSESSFESSTNISYDEWISRSTLSNNIGASASSSDTWNESPSTKFADISSSESESLGTSTSNVESELSKIATSISETVDLNVSNMDSTEVSSSDEFTSVLLSDRFHSSDGGLSVSIVSPDIMSSSVIMLTLTSESSSIISFAITSSGSSSPSPAASVSMELSTEKIESFSITSSSSELLSISGEDKTSSMSYSTSLSGLSESDDLKSSFLSSSMASSESSIVFSEIESESSRDIISVDTSHVFDSNSTVVLSEGRAESPPASVRSETEPSGSQVFTTLSMSVNTASGVIIDPASASSLDADNSTSRLVITHSIGTDVESFGETSSTTDAISSSFVSKYLSASSLETLASGRPIILSDSGWTQDSTSIIDSSRSSTGSVFESLGSKSMESRAVLEAFGSDTLTSFIVSDYSDNFSSVSSELGSFPVMSTSSYFDGVLSSMSSASFDSPSDTFYSSGTNFGHDTTFEWSESESVAEVTSSGSEPVYSSMSHPKTDLETYSSGIISSATSTLSTIPRASYFNTSSFNIASTSLSEISETTSLISSVGPASSINRFMDSSESVVSTYFGIESQIVSSSAATSELSSLGPDSAGVPEPVLTHVTSTMAYLSRSIASAAESISTRVTDPTSQLDVDSSQSTYMYSRASSVVGETSILDSSSVTLPSLSESISRLITNSNSRESMTGFTEVEVKSGFTIVSKSISESIFELISGLISESMSEASSEARSEHSVIAFSTVDVGSDASATAALGSSTIISRQIESQSGISGYYFSNFTSSFISESASMSTELDLSAPHASFHPRTSFFLVTSTFMSLMSSKIEIKSDSLFDTRNSSETYRTDVSTSTMDLTTVESVVVSSETGNSSFGSEPPIVIASSELESSVYSERIPTDDTAVNMSGSGFSSNTVSDSFTLAGDPLRPSWSFAASASIEESSGFVARTITEKTGTSHISKNDYITMSATEFESSLVDIPSTNNSVSKLKLSGPDSSFTFAAIVSVLSDSSMITASQSSVSEVSQSPSFFEKADSASRLKDLSETSSLIGIASKSTDSITYNGGFGSEIPTSEKSKFISATDTASNLSIDMTGPLASTLSFINSSSASGLTSPPFASTEKASLNATPSIQSAESLVFSTFIIVTNTECSKSAIISGSDITAASAGILPSFATTWTTDTAPTRSSGTSSDTSLSNEISLNRSDSVNVSTFSGCSIAKSDDCGLNSSSLTRELSSSTISVLSRSSIVNHSISGDSVISIERHTEVSGQISENSKSEIKSESIPSSISGLYSTTSSFRDHSPWLSTSIVSTNFSIGSVSTAKSQSHSDPGMTPVSQIPPTTELQSSTLRYSDTDDNSSCTTLYSTETNPEKPVGATDHPHSSGTYKNSGSLTEPRSLFTHDLSTAVSLSDTGAADSFNSRIPLTSDVSSILSDNDTYPSKKLSKAFMSTRSTKSVFCYRGICFTNITTQTQYEILTKDTSESIATSLSNSNSASLNSHFSDSDSSTNSESQPTKISIIEGVGSRSHKYFVAPLLPFVAIFF